MVVRKVRDRFDAGIVDAREHRVVFNAETPFAHQLYASTPNLEALVAASGLTEEEIVERLREQHHGRETLRRLENGEPMSRLVISRLTACLGLSHAEAKGEV
jgi:hypothetical protein